jgi:hypothetical protein
VRIWEHESAAGAADRVQAALADHAAVHGRTPSKRRESSGHARQPETARLAPPAAELL